MKKLTDQELRDIVANLSVSQKELQKSQKETDRQMKETDRQMKETGKKIKEIGKQIAGIGDKFGYFAEGMALPSMEKILIEKFKMETISPRVRFRNKKTGEEIEIDVLAYANSDVNEVYVVEVKSKLRKEGIEQTKKILDNFFKFFPEHKGKKLFGILAAIDAAPRDLKEEVLNQGIYYAEICDDVFSLKVPNGFEAKSW